MAYFSDYQPEGAPITGGKVLLIVLAFFGVIIAANMTMLYFAVTNFAGLEVKNSYVASQKFEADRARVRAAAISGWGVSIQAGEGTITLTVREADGAPVKAAELSAVVGRPSHNRQDSAIVFKEIAPGTYSAEIALAPGGWRLALSDAKSEGVARRFDFSMPKGAGGAS